MLSNSCSISQFLSLSLHLHSPYLPAISVSVQTSCLLLPTEFTKIPLQKLIPSGVFFIYFFPKCTLVAHRSSTVMQFVLTQTTRLSQHFNYLSQALYNKRRPSGREDFVSCYHNNNSDEFLLLSLAFFFLPNTRNWTSCSTGLKNHFCHQSAELYSRSCVLFLCSNPQARWKTLFGAQPLRPIWKLH